MKTILIPALLAVSMLVAGCTTPEESADGRDNTTGGGPEVSGNVTVVDPGDDTNTTGSSNTTNMTNTTNSTGTT